jgi:D-alanyl-D-alanine carboxypeptidase (penicillin-binding protein 5/6)
MSLFRQLLPFALSLFLASPALAQQLPVPPTLAAKSWLLLEMGSGQVLTAEKPDERLEPASLDQADDRLSDLRGPPEKDHNA